MFIIPSFLCPTLLYITSSMKSPLTFLRVSSPPPPSGLFWSGYSMLEFSSEPDLDSEEMKTILNLLLSGTIFFSSITMSLLLSDSRTAVAGPWFTSSKSILVLSRSLKLRLAALLAPSLLSADLLRSFWMRVMLELLLLLAALRLVRLFGAPELRSRTNFPELLLLLLLLLAECLVSRPAEISGFNSLWTTTV